MTNEYIEVLYYTHTLLRSRITTRYHGLLSGQDLTVLSCSALPGAGWLSAWISCPTCSSRSTMYSARLVWLQDISHRIPAAQYSSKALETRQMPAWKSAGFLRSV
jgi:hypothetical protein